MSTTALRRPHYTALAVAASIGIVYLAFRSYQSTENPRHAVELRRRNAVRRRNRRRPVPQGEDNDGTVDLNAEELAAHINNARTQSLGRYQNESLFPCIDGLDQINLDLTITNLSAIREHLVSHCTARWPYEWPAEAQQALDDHISAQFVLNFLNQAVNTWSLSEDSLRLLASALATVGIHPRVTYRVLLLGQTGHLQPHAWAFAPTVAPMVPHPSSHGVENGDDDGQSIIDHRGGDVEGDEGDEEEADNDDGQPVHVPQEEWDDTAGSTYMLGILYSISRDQARRDGYIHRGIECNSCGVCPIRGVRYHCSNCFDYDLCETCEANQVHVMSHVFYKIRIPAPSRGPIKQVLPKWYPGNPNAFPTNLPRAALATLKEETDLDITEIEALYDQFKCLGGARYPNDPCEIGMAIDRKGFDLYFIPGESDKLGPSKLIYDRIFAFYDRDSDGLISFSEFVHGLSDLQDNSRIGRLWRIMYGYDIDGDRYVSRRDFLRIFRAFYDLSKQLNHEMMASQEDFGCLDDEMRDVVDGSQPLSAAFGGSIFYGHQSRAGVDKSQAANGDLIISSGPNEVLQNDQGMYGDRERAIGNVAVGHRPRAHLFRTFRQDPVEDELLLSLPMPNNFELLGIQHADDATEADLNSADPPHQAYGWPPLLPLEPTDIINALDANISVDEINDPVDRSRVIVAQSERLDAETDRLLEWQREKAVNERWKRRQFYLDEEEGMTKPATYDGDSDVSIEESSQPEQLKNVNGAGSRAQSLRSRSSSKVRFDDSAIDTDYETRSNASSRGVPVNERWGGYELSNPGLDVGQDILYQAIQQGFNKLLDDLFLDAENQAMEAQASRKARQEFGEIFEQHKKAMQEKAKAVEQILKGADQRRKNELLQGHQRQQKQQQRQQESQSKPDEDPIGAGADAGAGASAGAGAGAGASAIAAATGADMAGRVAVADTNTAILESRIFGSQIEIGIAQALEERKLAAALTDDSKKDRALSSCPRSENESVDPTLPQNMPNEWEDIAVRSSGRLWRERCAPPSKETLNKWLVHEAIEREIKERGGPGRLSYQELRWKMRSKDDMNKTPPLSGHESKSEDLFYWEQSADLGKMSFIGTWLEIASF